MMYSVRLSKAAKKDLASLDPVTRKRVNSGLLVLDERGLQSPGLEALKGEYAG